MQNYIIQPTTGKAKQADEITSEKVNTPEKSRWGHLKVKTEFGGVKLKIFFFFCGYRKFGGKIQLL